MDVYCYNFMILQFILNILLIFKFKNTTDFHYKLLTPSQPTFQQNHEITEKKKGPCTEKT